MPQVLGTKMRVHVRGRGGTMHHLWVFLDLNLTVQQCENRPKCPIFLTIPGCVYIKSTVEVSGYGKNLRLDVDAEGYERGDRLENDPLS